MTKLPQSQESKPDEEEIIDYLFRSPYMLKKDIEFEVSRLSKKGLVKLLARLLYERNHD